MRTVRDGKIFQKDRRGHYNPGPTTADVQAQANLVRKMCGLVIAARLAKQGKLRRFRQGVKGCFAYIDLTKKEVIHLD